LEFAFFGIAIETDPDSDPDPDYTNDRFPEAIDLLRF